MLPSWIAGADEKQRQLEATVFSLSGEWDCLVANIDRCDKFKLQLRYLYQGLVY